MDSFAAFSRPLRVALPPLLPLLQRPSRRQVAVERVVRAGLVGHHVRPHSAAHQLRQQLRRIAQEPYRQRLPLLAGALDHRQRLVEVASLRIEIPGPQPHLDPRRLALDRQHRGPGHGPRQRLRPAHAAQPGGQDPPTPEIAAIMPPPDLDEGLVGALHDPLAADIDPGSGRHLAVHHEPLAIELMEMVPARPGRHQVRVRDQHARRIGMRPEDAHRLPRLHQQRLVRLQLPQASHNPIEALPIPRRPPDPAIDDQLLRPLRHLGVKIVHQHPQRCFGEPALRTDLRPARCPDPPRVVEPRHRSLLAQSSAVSIWCRRCTWSGAASAGSHRPGRASSV